jgi:hypothetical protein
MLNLLLVTHQMSHDMKPEPRVSSDKVLSAHTIGEFGLQLVPAPALRDWMTETADRFAYRCLPLLIANQSGWFILNNRSFTVTWSGLDAIGSLSIEYGPGAAAPLATSHFGHGILTWSIPILFRAPKGFNLLVRGPVNCPKDGIYPLDAVVEVDWATTPFTMNWKITRPHTRINFSSGEPMCMILPQRRGELEEFQPEIRSIASDEALGRRYEEWSTQRRDYINEQRSGLLADDDPGWQRHYFHGTHTNGQRGVNTHQTKLCLAPFEQK